ncbi:hypothetical protein D3C78_1525250 [compost metagenome]
MNGRGSERTLISARRRGGALRPVSNEYATEVSSWGTGWLLLIVGPLAAEVGELIKIQLRSAFDVR